MKKRISQKLRPETIIIDQLEKLEQDFEDVRDPPEDFRSNYNSSVPQFLLDNRLNLRIEDFDQFQKNYMQKKRQIEMNMIKENQDNEVIDQIV